MQPERPISVALVAISLAVVIPASLALLRESHTSPGISLAVGAIVGALGILLGSLGAVGYSGRLARILGLGFWIAIALALSGAAWFGAVQSASWGGRFVFGLVGFLPLVGPTLALRALWLEG